MKKTSNSHPEKIAANKELAIMLFLIDKLNISFIIKTEIIYVTTSLMIGTLRKKNDKLGSRIK